MSSDYDIEMSTDDTLELDAIIQEWDAESNSVIGNIKYNGNDSTVHNLTGIQTNTAIFDPQEDGSYTIPVNGQELTVNVTKASAITDSVVDRPDDDSVATNNPQKSGLVIKTSQSWAKFQTEISTNSGINYGSVDQTATKAYIEDSNRNIIDTASIPNDVNAGYVVTFDNAKLKPDSKYYILVDNDNNNYDYGYYNSPTFPYISNDDNLEITAGYDGQERTGQVYTFNRVGNINL